MDGGSLLKLLRASISDTAAYAAHPPATHHVCLPGLGCRSCEARMGSTPLPGPCGRRKTFCRWVCCACCAGSRVVLPATSIGVPLNQPRLLPCLPLPLPCFPCLQPTYPPMHSNPSPALPVARLQESFDPIMDLGSNTDLLPVMLYARRAGEWDYSNCLTLLLRHKVGGWGGVGGLGWTAPARGVRVSAAGTV